jgi:hypothetical protein
MKIIKKMMNDLNKMIKRRVKEILAFVYFVFSFVSVYFCNDELRTKFLIALVCLFVAVFLLIKFFEYIDREKEVEQLPKKRYTIKSKNGDVSVDSHELHQALVYLSILEDKIWGDI